MQCVKGPQTIHLNVGLHSRLWFYNREVLFRPSKYETQEGEGVHQHTNSSHCLKATYPPHIRGQLSATGKPPLFIQAVTHFGIL